MSRAPNNINPSTGKAWTPQERAAVPRPVKPENIPKSFMDRANKGGMSGQVANEGGRDPIAAMHQKQSKAPMNQVKKALGMPHMTPQGPSKTPKPQPVMMVKPGGQIQGLGGAKKPGMMAKMGIKKK